jgi:iron complex transport system permease protein
MPRSFELRAGRLSVRAGRRTTAYAAATLAVILVAACLTFTLGLTGIPLASLLPALFGHADTVDNYVASVLVGPRLVTGAFAGALLGTAGTLVQTLTRNPLGSPDVIGISAGAGAGAAAVAMFARGVIPIPLGAVAGAAVAVLVLLVATRGRLSSPNRIIVAGVGISAFGVAFTYFALTSFQQQDATTLAAYIVGSLEAKDWATAIVAVLAVVVLLPLAGTISHRLSLVELGDELAESLGGSLARTRTFALLLAIAAAAVAVGAVGPIAFVALAAPQIAKGLAATNGSAVTISALTGAAIIVVSDLLVQQLPVTLPVGVLTALVGAVYLGFVLTGQWKKGTVG